MQYRVWTLAACAGATVMVAELGAGRMLTPAFGGGIEVWAVVIAVTMAALAAGYALGGRWADEHGGLRVALTATVLSACFLAATPVIRTPVLAATEGLETAAGCALGCAVFLAPTLMLLGMVGPALIRELSHNAETVGTIAGRVTAVSTGGSLAGALLAGLWALPHYSLTVVYGVTAAGLLVCAAWAGARPWLVSGSAALLLLSFGDEPTLPVVTVSGVDIRVVERTNSAYGDLRVVERGHRRTLLANGIDQGGVDIHTGQSLYSYSDTMVDVASQTLGPQPGSALLIGLGPGVIATDLVREGWRVDVVELDPQVVSLAHRWFGFTGEAWVGDGRRALAALKGPWDLILVDAYLSGSPPWHLFTAEAFDEYAQRLRPGGLVVLNLIGNPNDPEQRPALDSVLATAATAFSHVEAWPDPTQDPSAPTRNLYITAAQTGRTHPARSHRGRPNPLTRTSPIQADTGRILSDDSGTLSGLVRPTARHVRTRAMNELPAQIRLF